MSTSPLEDSRYVACIDKEELHKIAQIVSDAGKYGYPSWEELHGIMGKGGKGKKQGKGKTPKTPLTEKEKAAIAQDEKEKDLRLSDAFGRFWKRKKCPYVQLEFEQLKEEGKLLPGDVVDTRYTERSDKHLDLLYRRWMEKEGEVSI